MEGHSQTRNGRSGPARSDKVRWASAGFQIPRENLTLDADRFWQLTGEGWRFVVGEDGCIIACMPPTLGVRLEALTESNILKQKKAAQSKKRGHQGYGQRS